MALLGRTGTRRRSTIVLLFSMLMIFGLVAAASATPPSGVLFEVPTTNIVTGGSFGPFTASGPAVDDGLMCPSGETIDVFGKVSGFQSERGFNLQIVKEFTCSDGSGSFLVKLQVRIVDTVDTFNWNIVGGTGDYVDLKGAGSGVGLDICGDDCVLDVYNGGLHID